MNKKYFFNTHINLSYTLNLEEPKSFLFVSLSDHIELKIFNSYKSAESFIKNNKIFNCKIIEQKHFNSIEYLIFE